MWKYECLNAKETSVGIIIKVIKLPAYTNISSCEQVMRILCVLFFSPKELLQITFLFILSLSIFEAISSVLISWGKFSRIKSTTTYKIASFT